MYKYLFAATFLLAALTVRAQESPIPTDSLETEEKKWDVSLDVLSRYIWRGQSWGGNYIAVQPTFNYAISGKWTASAWATTNFQSHYYENDGVTPKGYQEFDLGITYAVNDFLSVSAWDYYWPAYENFEGVDRNYFNYGPDGVKTVDLSLEFDFSEGYKYPFNATISTLIAGNDYRYDSNGENPKQNFTTYAEVGYTFDHIFGTVSKVFRDISMNPTVGAVFNNEAEYYTYADYDRVSFVNLTLNATREFDLGHGLTMPVQLNYTHNAANKNTEPFGKDFVTAGVSFYY